MSMVTNAEMLSIHYTQTRRMGTGMADWWMDHQINMSSTYRHHSKQILHQAALLYNQSITRKLDNNLLSWKSTHKDVSLPDEWGIEGIADKFANYWSIIAAAPAVSVSGGTTTIVNQLQTNNNNRGVYNKRKKKIRNASMQCTCCKRGGHQLGDKVCQIGAKFHHIQVYKENIKKNLRRMQ